MSFLEEDNNFGATTQVRSAILQRQREMNDLTEYKFKSLENVIKQKDMDLNMERQKYKNLKEDFEYNLKLLEGRDDELARYDSTFANLKRIIAEKYKSICKLLIF